MKHALIIFFCLLLSATGRANMGNPLAPGTIDGIPFISKYASVEHEDLYFDISGDFKTAMVRAVYYIHAEKDGMQIPLMFYTSGYKSDFEVKVDGELISLLEVPDIYEDLKDSSFSVFDTYIDRETGYFTDILNINGSNYFTGYLYMSDLHYFETNLSVGTHIIEVSYESNCWINTSGIVKDYSFCYFLHPAKDWKSFGTLNIYIDASKFKDSLYTNLDEFQMQEAKDSLLVWQFDSLPADMINIRYSPKLDKVASSVLNLGYIFPGIVISMILTMLHILWMWRFRKRKPFVKFSWPFLVGALLVPVLFAFSIISWVEVIDLFIGEHSSNKQGYGIFFFLVAVLPISWLVYTLVSFGIDMLLKRKYRYPEERTPQKLV